MGRLSYTAVASLDGYVNGKDGGFEWAAPDEEVHAFVNDLERPIGTYLLGRRMYETMRFWETPDAMNDPSPVARDFAQIWRAADKVVYSTTLDDVSTARTRIERAFDPDAVRRMKTEAAQDISIGGPHLAAHALRAALVDELDLFITPVVVGGGTHWLPHDVRLDLEPLDVHRFAGGVVYLRYRTRTST